MVILVLPLNLDKIVNRLSIPDALSPADPFKGCLQSLSNPVTCLLLSLLKSCCYLPDSSVVGWCLCYHSRVRSCVFVITAEYVHDTSTEFQVFASPFCL